jgi:inorganic pyrophosphatase
MLDSFWTRLETLIGSCEIVIDRPKGSTHPRYPAVVYPLDYGYLRGTSGGDGNEIDVWRGSLPGAGVDAVVCTVDAVKRDAEVKLMMGCTKAEKETVLDFLNSGYMSAVLVQREEGSVSS